MDLKGAVISRVLPEMTSLCISLMYVEKILGSLLLPLALLVRTICLGCLACSSLVCRAVMHAAVRIDNLKLGHDGLPVTPLYAGM